MTNNLNEEQSFDTDELDEFDIAEPITEVYTYEVWALSYDKQDQIRDTEVLLGSFDNPDKAVAFAKTVQLQDILKQVTRLDENIAYFNIEVETVVESEDEGTLNVGTIFRRGGIEVVPEVDVKIDPEEVIFLQDGLIRIPSPSADYKIGDTLTVLFADMNASPMTYKVVDASPDFLICDFVDADKFFLY